VDVLGIDVSKQKFQVALLRAGKVKSHTFQNAPSGFTLLQTWLGKQQVSELHACMESTGGYGDALATYLHDEGYQISIINPSQVKAFAGSELLRTKTDSTDAALIARFCAAQKPAFWQPPSPTERLLQGLVRRRSDLLEMRAKEGMRLQSPTLQAEVRTSIEQLTKFLDGEIAAIDEQIRKLVDDDPDLRKRRDILTSIPGFAERTASTLLGEIPNMEEFRCAKAVAAYAGLSPRHHQSGIFVGRSRLSKIGNARVRHALYFPAMVAIRHNQAMAQFAHRLRERGKRPMVIIAAVMRRLLVLAYTLLRTQRHFEPNYAQNA
jgi:transposase